MKPILAGEHRGILESLAATEVLLAFDYDGTLTAIANDPTLAKLTSTTGNLLKEVAQLYPCAVISGRSRRELERLLKGVGIQSLTGNHGLDLADRVGQIEKSVRRFRIVLQKVLARHPGVVIEDKGLSLSLDYRNAPRKRFARAAIVRAAGNLEGARLVNGKLGVGILPEVGANKSTALEKIQRALGCPTALYVGDDETDEDVFKWANPDRVLTVRVGRCTRSHASCFIPKQRDIDRLLRLFVELRACPTRQRRPLS